jgi:hypothetical protein
MQIKTKRQINARTQDGRVYAAGEGTVSEFDDDDAGMIGMAKSLIASGQAEHYGDAGEVDDGDTDAEQGAGEQTPPVDPPAEDDLDALRADAEAAGVKVDKRWGADRLREEIALAVGE